METTTETRCTLLKPVRDHAGTTHYAERPVVKRKITNLDRTMFLVAFENGETTFVFPDEIAIEE